MVAHTLTARVDQIGAHAREVDASAVVSHALLTVVAALLVLVGKIPGRLVRAAVWAGVAVRVGYREGRGLPPLGDAGGSA